VEHLDGDAVGRDEVDRALHVADEEMRRESGDGRPMRAEDGDVAAD
jgi:hypothetical protein